MKHPSDDLWQLIRSLTPQEKMFFRREHGNAAGETEPLFVRLFEVLNKQNSYDEQSALDILGPELDKKNISYTKNYLSSRICDTLIRIEPSREELIQLYQLLFRIRILRKKGLYRQAIRIWQQAIEKARLQEQFNLILELREEYRKMQFYNNPAVQHEELVWIYDDQMISLDDHNHYLLLQDIYFRSLLFRRKGHFRLSEGDIQEISILLERVVQTPFPQHSFICRHYSRMSQCILWYLMGDLQCYVFALENMQDWLQHSSRIAQDSENYVEALYMFYYCAILTREYADIERFMNNPVNNNIQDPIGKAYYETIKYIALNRLYNRTAQFEKVAAILPYMIAQAPVWEAHINSDLSRTLRLSVGIASFVLERYEDAYFYIKNAMLVTKDHTRQDLYSFAHLFLLLICYELKDVRRFLHQYKAAYTYFYRNEKPLPFEKFILNTLYKNFKELDKAKRYSNLEALYQALQATSSNPVQKRVFSMFNFPGWIQSKIRKMAYKDWVAKETR